MKLSKIILLIGLLAVVLIIAGCPKPGQSILSTDSSSVDEFESSDDSAIAGNAIRTSTSTVYSCSNGFNQVNVKIRRADAAQIITNRCSGRNLMTYRCTSPAQLQIRSNNCDGRGCSKNACNPAPVAVAEPNAFVAIENIDGIVEIKVQQLNGDGIPNQIYLANGNRCSTVQVQSPRPESLECVTVDNQGSSVRNSFAIDQINGAKVFNSNSFRFDLLNEGEYGVLNITTSWGSVGKFHFYTYTANPFAINEIDFSRFPNRGSYMYVALSGQAFFGAEANVVGDRLPPLWGSSIAKIFVVRPN